MRPVIKNILQQRQKYAELCNCIGQTEVRISRLQEELDELRARQLADWESIRARPDQSIFVAALGEAIADHPFYVRDFTITRLLK